MAGLIAVLFKKEITSGMQKAAKNNVSGKGRAEHADMDVHDLCLYIHLIPWFNIIIIIHADIYEQ